MAKPDPMQAIDVALDRISYYWMVDNHPDLAEAIEDAIDKGTSSAEIRRYVQARTYRVELALRAEQAGRHCERLAND